MLGILGGMGPAATVDLMQRVVALTPAKNDQDHIPIIVCCDPRVPSMAEAIFRGSTSPLAAMVRGIRILEASNAQCIAIACHSAFHWYEELTATTHLPIIHIADAVCAAVSARIQPGGLVGLIAAGSTLRSGFYQRKLAERNYRCALLSEKENEELVFPAIKLVKQNHAGDASPMFREAITRLRGAGASTVILACTEIPVALRTGSQPDETTYVDGTEVLARACVEWWLNRKWPELQSGRAVTDDV